MLRRLKPSRPGPDETVTLGPLLVDRTIQTSVQGHPARTLLSRAAGTSLIVLGVHESPKLRDLVYDQVAVKCLKHAVGPVVIIGRDGLPVFRSEHQPVDMPADAMTSEKVSVSAS